MNARDEVLSIIRQCAREGSRCPTEAELREHLHSCGLTLSTNARPSAMAKEGLLRSEVYARNWRVIEFPDGLRTAEAPRGLTLYRVIDKDSSRYL